MEVLKEKGKDGMELNLPPKLMKKLVYVVIISFCKIFILS